MRTKLFHTIVLFGATLGVAAACSDDGDDSANDQHKGGTHGTCSPGTMAGLSAGGGGGEAMPDAAAGCGGWPPTK